NKKPQSSTNTPIVTLFHGLEGSYKSPYIIGMMSALEKAGFSSVVMHFRGCSGKENLLPRSYHSGETGDAKAWIAHLQKCYPHAPLFAIGYSLGGNMLLKLISEWGESSPLKASVSISAPMQLDICANQMNRGFSKIYQAHLVKHLNHSLTKKYQKHPMQSLLSFKEKDIKTIKTFWEFDNIYTAPIHGFASAKDYYKRSSSKQFLKDIKQKTLIIHALDDPFMTPEVIAKPEEISENIEMELYPHGGHVGFISGSFFNPKYWLEKRIPHYFMQCQENS
ncbi:MAG: hydrolase, partial [Campylobacterota bacterium]|nr:hydrolase [Campylobacterota bacterium]